MMQIEISNDDLFHLVKKIVLLECLEDLKIDFFAAAKESIYRNAYWISDVTYISDCFESASSNVYIKR